VKRLRFPFLSIAAYRRGFRCCGKKRNLLPFFRNNGNLPPRINQGQGWLYSISSKKEKKKF